MTSLFLFFPRSSSNGVQAISNGLQQLAPGHGGLAPRPEGGRGVGGGVIGEEELKTNPSSSSSSRADHAHIPQHMHRQSSRDLDHSPHQHHQTTLPKHSNSLSKDDQDLFLHAHFSSGTSAAMEHSITSNPPGAYPGSRDKEEFGPAPRYHTHHPSPSEGNGGRALHIPITGSNFIPTLTQVPVTCSHLASRDVPMSSLPPSHTPILEYPTHHMDHAPQQDSAPSIHEITQVTNSVHAPISSLTPLPNENSDGYCGSGLLNNVTVPLKKDSRKR